MLGRLPFSRSLLYPLTAILVLLAVIPVGLAGWGFVTSNREQVETLEKQYLTRQAVGLAREFELLFMDTVGRLEAVGLALEAGARVSTDPEAAARVPAELVQTRRDFVMVRLLDRSGMGPFALSRTLAGLDEDAVEEALGELFTVTRDMGQARRELIQLPSGEPVMLVSLPIREQGAGAAWVVQGAVSLASLQERLAEESGRGVMVDVVDQAGLIVFSSDPDRILRSAVHHPLVAQFLQAPVRLTTAYVDPLRPTETGEVLGSLCPMESPSWAVVTARDTDLAFAAVRAMAHRTALLAVLTALVATGAGVLLARRITSPLRSLAAVSTAVAGGDFAKRVPVRGRNELGQLADNFNVMAEEIEEYISSLQTALQENQQLLVDSIRALAAAIDAKNPYTRGHSERVSRYSVTIARHYGLADAEVKKVEIAALLHDVGKIGINDAILQKPEELTDAEFAQMRAHAAKGAAIVSPISRLRDMLPGIKYHHENWDGKGYPEGLAAEKIPLVARIIAAADVFDAMTTHRPYQKALRLEFVLGRMRELSGTRLDPRVVEAFFSAVSAGDVAPSGQEEVA